MKRRESLDGEVILLRAAPRWWDVSFVLLFLVATGLAVPFWGTALLIAAHVLHLYRRGSELWRVTVGLHRVQFQVRLPFFWQTRATLALDEIQWVKCADGAMEIRTHDGRVLRVLAGMKRRDLTRLASELSERAERRAVPTTQADEAQRQRQALEALTRERS